MVGIKFILLALWFIFIIFLSHQNGAESGRESRKLAYDLRFIFGENVEKTNRILRKGAHTFVYFIFGLLWCWCFGINTLLIIPALLGFADEYSKPLLKNFRHADFKEMLLDELGLFLALAVWAIW